MDIIKPFILEDGLFRGFFIGADETVTAMTAHHKYPKVVKDYLGQLAVLALALSAGIKYDGTFSLQIKGGGPITTAFVDVTKDHKIRGYAVYDEKALPANSTDIKTAFGNGQMIFSVASLTGEPYQGIVQLVGQTLGDTVKEYFNLSEQIKTDLVLRGQKGETRLILLQQMPVKTDVSKEKQDDLFETLSVLMQSVKDIELFSGKLTPDEILFRLFHANELRVLPDNIPSHECRCYRGKMLDFLKKLSPAERADLFQDGKITAGCQFCNEQYIFTEDDFK